MTIRIKKYTSPFARTLGEATWCAYYFTRRHKQYITSVKINGKWYLTNRFDPRVEK